MIRITRSAVVHGMRTCDERMTDESFLVGSKAPPAHGPDPFMKSVFGGVIAEGLVFPYPEPTRGESDQVLAILDQLRKFNARFIDGGRIDRDEVISQETLDGLKDIGAFGWLVPREFGGAGLDLTSYARVMQELSAIDGSVGTALAAHQSLAVAALILYGTPEQKSRWLPRLAKGEAIGAFALAESGAGSDAGSIQTRADRDGDFYVLSGEKTWVIGGRIADVFIVFARTSPSEDGAKPKLTAFVVPRSQGVRAGAVEPTLGMRASGTATVIFDRVRVPTENVLFEAGRGFKVATGVLSQARLSLAASCVGIAKRFLKLSVDRVSDRKAFGRRISEFGLIKDKIAQMTAAIFAMESVTYLTTGMAARGQLDISVESAISKVFCSESLIAVATEAMQIAGSLGYTRNQPYERLLRDARAAMTFQGTNEILRAFIALSGMQGLGREIEEVSRAMREPIKGFGLLGDFALRKARSALSRERLGRAHPVLAREAVIFEEFTGQLAKSVDKVLRRHGKNIAEMQYTQKRAANVAIDLYVIAAVVSRTTRAIEKRGEEGARREIDLTSIVVTAARKRLAEEISAFDENDDELRKAVAQKTCADGGYPLDVL